MTAAIILAAGAAVRMGRLKQLLIFRGKSLIQRSIQQATGAGFEPVIVVVGAERDAVRAALVGERVEIVENDQWERGMGSSVIAGIDHLQAIGSDCTAVALLVADQPLVTAIQLAEMTSRLLAGPALAIAAQYDNTVGVPALFRRELFPALASLSPEAGARHILRNPKFEIARFDLSEAGFDIDTPEDFAALERKVIC